MRQVYEEDTNYASIRFWNFLPPGHSLITVKKSGSGPSSKVVDWLPEVPPSSLSGYGQVSPGNCQVIITDASGEKELAKTQFRGKPQQFFTVVAKSDAPDGEIELTVIDDTYEFDPDASATLTIYNEVPEVTVTAKTPTSNGPEFRVTNDSPVKINDVPPTTAEMILSISAPGEPPMEQSVPLGLDIGKRMSIIVAKDAYGRIRPIAKYDGYVYAPAAMEPVPED